MFGKKAVLLATTSSLFMAFATLAGAANVNIEIYGKINVSGDYIDNGNTTDITVASNSSRLGFKGKKALKHNLQAIWKLESELDVSGEKFSDGTTGLKSRNRYLGLSHELGTVIVGYHDTPYKTFGGMAGVFHDSIAERRGILGAGNGDNKMNIRAKNSVMYTSPKWNNVQLKLMRSTGEDGGSTGDEMPVTSSSLVYNDKTYYFGVSYEEQTSLDATGLRIGGGTKFGDTTLNLMYEGLNSSTRPEFDRAAYGGSVTHKIGDAILKAQIFMADDYKNQKDSGGMIWGLGADYKLDKSFTIYGIVAGVNNDENSKIVLAGSGHGEKYAPAAAGDSMLGVSGGMIYSF
jgi:predicted porin